MEKDINEMLGLIINKIDRLESRFDGLESKMDRLGAKVDRLESRQDEIYLVVKTIEHNNQVHGAEVDNFRHKVHYMEGTLNTIGDLITTRKAIK